LAMPSRSAFTHPSPQTLLDWCKYSSVVGISYIGQAP
jgi:hypothetical protein